jgi:hypothetical protein
MTKRRNMHRRAATRQAKERRWERQHYADSPGTSRKAGASKINKIVKKWRTRRGQLQERQPAPRGFLW